MFRDILLLMNIAKARCGEVSPAPSFAWRVGIEAGVAVSHVRDILFFLIVAPVRCGEVSPAPSFARRVGIEVGDAVFSGGRWCSEEDLHN